MGSFDSPKHGPQVSLHTVHVRYVVVTVSRAPFTPTVQQTGQVGCTFALTSITAANAPNAGGQPFCTTLALDHGGVLQARPVFRELHRNGFTARHANRTISKRAVKLYLPTPVEQENSVFRFSSWAASQPVSRHAMQFPCVGSWFLCLAFGKKTYLTLCAHVMRFKFKLKEGVQAGGWVCCCRTRPERTGSVAGGVRQMDACEIPTIG